MFHSNWALSQNEEWNIKGDRYIQKMPRSGKICCEEHKRYEWEKIWLNGKKKKIICTSKTYSVLNQKNIMTFPGVLVSVIIVVIKHNDKQQIGKKRIYLFYISTPHIHH